MGQYRRKKRKFTSMQHCATQRNWCIYVLNGMIALCGVFSKFGVDQEKVERLAKTLNSFRYTIDWTWEKHKETLREAEVDGVPQSVVKDFSSHEIAQVIELHNRSRR